ncbi:hypothetical protein [Paraburkholderia humisilvae]|uniref:Uncharacterized protein n=1 Tax=Paraburkholderia humisilvae TaxID=627669 RepID=A0A6J5DN16_9BURK|nr:hypothetical protein [Paraburkholderia humisilvae]CAB3754611.1 hypothetical protein LMG29542_02398 [Paraburkholderia humisilvae]
MDLIEVKEGVAGAARPFDTGRCIDLAAVKLAPMNFIDGWREDPDGLMELLQRAVPVYLEADSTRRVVALIGRMMRETPRANLMDLYRTLHAEPEFAAFANAMLHGFVPGRHVG